MSALIQNVSVVKVFFSFLSLMGYTIEAVFSHTVA